MIDGPELVRAQSTVGYLQRANTSAKRQRRTNGTSSPPAPSMMRGPAVLGGSSSLGTISRPSIWADRCGDAEVLRRHLSATIASGRSRPSRRTTSLSVSSVNPDCTGFQYEPFRAPVRAAEKTVFPMPVSVPVITTRLVIGLRQGVWARRSTIAAMIIFIYIAEGYRNPEPWLTLRHGRRPDRAKIEAACLFVELSAQLGSCCLRARE